MEPHQADQADRQLLGRKPARVGCVSFLNAKPLIYGLGEPDVDLLLEVPSRLLTGLRKGRFDVALLPAIDYQRIEGLRVLSAGGICCDGPTLTVRIFSAVPIENVRALACDTDSHTSVALARILLAERYGLRPEFTDLPPIPDPAAPDAAHHGGPLSGLSREGTARLLIGDKVISNAPRDLPYQLDLGEAWKQWTGLPFVFAAWMVRGGVDLGGLPSRLQQAKRDGLANIEQIVARDAASRGWPAEVARRYLTRHLQFDLTHRHFEAMRLFYDLAARHGIIETPPREVELYDGEAGRPTR